MSKINETPATVTDENTEVSETEAAEASAISALMQQLEENFMTKKDFYKRAAIIAGVTGTVALAIGFALGRSTSSDDTDEDSETTED